MRERKTLARVPQRKIYLNKSFEVHGEKIPDSWRRYFRNYKLSLGASLVAQMVKKSVCSERNLGSISELRRTPGETNGYPLQYSCLENSMDRGAWWATVHGVARVGHDSVTTPPPHFVQEWLSLPWAVALFFCSFSNHLEK